MVTSFSSAITRLTIGFCFNIFVLIAILGTALSGMMNGQNPNINVKVTFIEHGDEAEQVDRFMNEIENDLPQAAVEGIQSGIDGMMPISILKKEVFGSEDLKEIVEINEVHLSERTSVLDDNTYTTVIEVPDNFTYQTLKHMVLDQDTQPTLKVTQNDQHQIGSSIVSDVLNQFQEQLTLGTFLEKNGIDQNAIQLDEESYGEVTTINQKKSVTSKGYYAVGMAVMNVLFIASTIGSMAFLEKKIHVFDRVILANVSRWVYFTGVLISGTIIGFFHLLIVFGFAWLVFGVSWPDLIAFFTVTLAFAAAVGGIAVLLTAISYRFNSEVITNFFSGIVVTIMAVLGGSFFPLGDSSAIIRTLGNLTPNGAGMSAYLTILRGDGISQIGSHIFFLIIFAIVTVIIAALSFPKRGLAK
ncbi:hypothetical protein CIL05_10440 [Virgibacillus profundi]|uniref:ABC-2 type transporter transmembrane domain-containing protein n=1 Tax=Virgibacillus profundi TaxID=2024555 RepID=A0A2A2IEU0_9BACI|nr:ABC transporter permease [Virgibacillus profundi]PAV29774.1 hypothetical protein CIL05_10440 [Virgibacillus profundi]PXY53946.1 ABC transporter permease [Virgibacillus profundi]